HCVAVPNCPVQLPLPVPPSAPPLVSVNWKVDPIAEHIVLLGQVPANVPLVPSHTVLVQLPETTPDELIDPSTPISAPPQLGGPLANPLRVKAPPEMATGVFRRNPLLRTRACHSPSKAPEPVPPGPWLQEAIRIVAAMRARAKICLYMFPLRHSGCYRVQ